MAIFPKLSDSAHSVYTLLKLINIYYIQFQITGFFASSAWQFDYYYFYQSRFTPKDKNRPFEAAIYFGDRLILTEIFILLT